ncbi:MAG: hypothetical protein ABI760_24995 [Ferruginibacter sp.]
MKIKIQRAIFWKEVNLIQKRHLLFFPDEQRKYIRIRESDMGLNLEIRDCHDLPSEAIMEIRLAFKFAGEM